MYNNFFKCETRFDELHLCDFFKDYDEFYQAWKKQENEVSYVDFIGRFEGWEFIPQQSYVKLILHDNNNTWYEIPTTNFFDNFWFCNPTYDADNNCLYYQVTGI